MRCTTKTRNERDRHQGMNGTLPRSARAREFNREMSSGHFVMMYMFRKILNIMCEWSHSCDESERSLMTSLIRCFWVRFEQSAGRSEGHVPIIVALPGPSVAPVDGVQMKPCFMMATLIIRSQAECFSWDGECTMLVHFPKSIRTRWFEKSTDVCPVVRNGSRSPQWCGARWRRQGTISKGFVNSTEVVSAATSPPSTIEKNTSNQVNFLRNHDGTKSENELHGDAFLLGVDVADM